MKHPKLIANIKYVLVGMAILSSIWAAYSTIIRTNMHKMIFTDIHIPKRSVHAFLHDIPESVRDDIFIGLQRGLESVIYPLIIAGALWITVYLWTEYQNKD